LQRHHEIHHSDHERHRHEEDHDRAMCREDLVEMLRRQVSLRTPRCDRLLRPHHDGVGKPSQQHDQRQYDVHDADTLMVDRGNPLTPEIRHVTLEGDPRKDGYDRQDHAARRAHNDRLVEGDRTPIQLAE
jgi:hypothetical protein